MNLRTSQRHLHYNTRDFTCIYVSVIAFRNLPNTLPNIPPYRLTRFLSPLASLFSASDKLAGIEYATKKY